MLGIESIQKMNRLAKDLYDQKVADSMEEAAKMAEGIISKGNTMTEVKERMDNAPPPPAQASAPPDADMVLRRLNFQINEERKRTKGEPRDYNVAPLCSRAIATCAT